MVLPRLAALLLLMWANLAPAEWFSESRPMMGTIVSVYFWNDDSDADNRLPDAVFDEAARIDRLMSTYRDDSEISKINRGGGRSHVGPELFALIERSLEMSLASRGAFDITYDSVGQHYDFRERRLPSEEVVAAELSNIDFRHVRLDSATQTVEFKKQGVRINLGGIAKGYVVERGIAILRDAGIKHAIVTAGGDSRLLGDRRGRPWMVGIRHPRVDGEVALSLPLQDEAVSTSGDYERFFDQDGVRYHHIINPSTGHPAGGVHSATVIGPDAVTTDALSTSVFVMGVDEGIRLIDSMPEYESVVISATGAVFFSDGLEPPEQPSGEN